MRFRHARHVTPVVFPDDRIGSKECCQLLHRIHPVRATGPNARGDAIPLASVHVKTMPRRARPFRGGDGELHSLGRHKWVLPGAYAEFPSRDSIRASGMKLSGS